MAGRTFMTKVWGFGEPAGPLQFSTDGWRDNARAELEPGDVVVLVGTKDEPTLDDERGRLLGIMEPTTEPVMSLDFRLPTNPGHFDAEGNYKWPFGLLNRRAWRFLDRPLLVPDVSRRRFAMDSALGIVLLTPEEAARVAALRREEVELLRPRIAALARIEGFEAARRRVSPPPTTKRQGIMHMRSAPAHTYSMMLEGAESPAFKIGWAFDYRQRARQFNQSSLPTLGGLRYSPMLFQLWDTARQAFRMEQEVLNHFARYRHRDNHEVLVGLSAVELQAFWINCVRGL